MNITILFKMRTLSIVLLSIILLVLNACGTENEQWDPFSIKSLEIKHISIIGTGISKPNEGNNFRLKKESCRKLHLSQQRVITLLKNATVVSKEQWDYELDKAGCISYGYLTTSRNQRLEWQIDLLGSAFIKDAQDITYLKLNGDIEEGARY